MGENWWLDFGPFSSGSRPGDLFELALRYIDKNSPDKKITKCSDKLDQLRAEESKQKLVLLNSAMSGETDLVASVKLSELEQDIQIAEQDLLNAQLEQKHNDLLAVDLMDRVVKYQVQHPEYWPDELDSEEN